MPARIRDFDEQYPGARADLQGWSRVVKAAERKNFPDLRRTFPHAGQVDANRGRSDFFPETHKSYRTASDACVGVFCPVTGRLIQKD